MKIITVVGARPQFIKAGVVSKALQKSCNFNEIMIHTGQHYDKNMSDIFFEELGIPEPKYNLGVGSYSHGKQTAKILEGIENILLNEKPEALMVYGDTNSTLAGALAASKLHIPVVHIEAGLRSFNKLMPEEQNRIITDHISNVLFCPTQTAVINLANEGIRERVFNTGDVMYDSTLMNREIALTKMTFSECVENMVILFGDSNIIEKEYYLATIHRAENTDSIEKLNHILNGFEKLGYRVLFLVHPRTYNLMKDLIHSTKYKNIIFSRPVSYLQMIILTSFAKKVLTDSGGLQKEAYFLEIPCVTLRDQTEWTETLEGNWNILCGINEQEIVNKTTESTPDKNVLFKKHFGDGKASEKIESLLTAVVTERDII
ncbi:MAG: UDP-N-acetylglucosamine 2-epimerase (non-hydrolyzing) [Eubacteriales bacterium]|nr:UDP-N-acetylglucosamine 2-epimerase (non-hydrolyzing) [Eubacteriales bacterium]